MIARKPIKSKSTERIIKAIIPSEFKMANDKNSNGYKFINLLYGAEVDQTIASMREVYNNSFLNTIDLSKKYELYEVNISGVPISNYLVASGSNKIKITDEYEFYEGAPTRIVPKGTINIPMYYLPYTGYVQSESGGFANSFANGLTTPCWSSMSGFTGLEYMRYSSLGSGYLFISSDVNQQDAFNNRVYPMFVCEVGSNFKTSGDYLNTYGLYTGIKTQDYINNYKHEILYPEDSRTLSGKYPLTRMVRDESGIAYSIDHYEPYHGWMFNEFNEAIAIVDYSGAYQFDDEGKKTYYRTAYNNPYGYNNYSTSYLKLERTPISGSIKVLDIDILDGSGNAIEIPKQGVPLYRYRSPKMLTGSGNSDALFDPVYVGYDKIVPSGYGFSDNMVGATATFLQTISWDYLYEDSGLDNDTRSYSIGSGNIINGIQIKNPYSRYLVEYKYSIYDKIKYITSLDSNNITSLYNSNPTYTVDATSGILNEIDYKFTVDPSYGNDASKVITFDAYEVRPNKNISQIDFNIPVLFQSGPLNKKLNINTNKRSIGYHDDWIPQVSTFRNYLSNCKFNQEIFSGTSIESDYTGNSNSLVLETTGNAKAYRICYNGEYGKKIIKGTTGEIYYYINNKSFLFNDIHFAFEFRANIPNEIILLDTRDSALNKYLIAKIDETGQFTINSNGYKYYFAEKIIFNNEYKYLTIKYTVDELSSNVDIFKVYYKEQNDFGFRTNRIIKVEDVDETVSDTMLKVYKDSTIDAGAFKIFYEAQ